MNFSTIFSWHAKRNPDKVAIYFEDSEISYGELYNIASNFSNSIRISGGLPGDIVAILLHNQPEFLYTAVGSNRAGLAFLPLNYRLAARELAYILANSGAKFLVSQNLFRDTIDQIRPELPHLKHYLLTDVNENLAGWTSFREFTRSSSESRQEDYEAKPEDLHRLMYTSGTTANPKGVMITFSNMWWKTFAHCIDLETSKNDTALIAGPLYHVGAFDLAASHVFFCGGSSVILRKFDPLDCIHAIEKYKVTVTWLAPSMLNMVLGQDDIALHDLSSMRLIIDGGEKMPEPLINKLLSVFPNTWYADAYGLTETVSGDTFVPREFMKSKLGSVGRATLFTELKIVDENSNEVRVGTEGEIVIKGPKVFPGYWKDPQGTKNVLRNGWFHTGDMGYLDQEGFLYILDRKKDMIKSGGENVSSLEIERALYQNSNVQETAVIGMPDLMWGEVPVAFVVLKAGSFLSEDDLMRFCSDKIAKFKIPKKIIFQTEPLPRNPSGKVLKRVLREKLQPETSRS